MSFCLENPLLIIGFENKAGEDSNKLMISRCGCRLYIIYTVHKHGWQIQLTKNS